MESETETVPDSNPGDRESVSGPRAKLRREPLPEGTEVGRYTVERKVGEGGMGVVYAARDRELRRKVALKILRTDRDERPAAEAQRRMLREARSLAMVSHPNLITVYEVGTYIDHVFLAMEFVTGPNLADWLDREPRSIEDVMEVFEQAGWALQAVHEAGLVHRDFKPENVIVSDAGMAKLLDLGIARRSEALPEPVKSSAYEMLEAQSSGDRHRVETLEDSFSENSHRVGTPEYMAPEQLLDTPITSAVDQFAFGIALYEALVGVRPFEGKTDLERISNTIGGRLRPWPEDTEVPERLRIAIAKMLSGAPEDRFASMEEALSACRDALGIRGQIRFLTRRWIRHDRTEQFLLPDGALLTEGRELLDRKPEALAPEHVAFIEASDAARRRRRRQRRGLIAGVTLLTLAIVPTIYLLRERTQQLEASTQDRVSATIGMIRDGVEELFEREENELRRMMDQRPVWMPGVEALSEGSALPEEQLVAHLEETVTELNAYFRPVVARSETISSLMVATDSLELLVFDDPGSRRLERPYVFYNRLVRTDAFGDSAFELFWHEDAPPESRWLREGEQDRHGNAWSGYDPRSRVWFQRAMATGEGEVAWTEPYRFFVTKDVGITGAMTWTHRGVEHVLAVDLMLTDISQFTRSIQTPDVLAIVITRGEEVVGLPRDPRFQSDEDVRAFFADYERPGSDSDNPHLPRVDDLGVGLLSAAMAKARDTDAEIFEIEHEGTAYWVGHGPIGTPQRELSALVVAKPQ